MREYADCKDVRACRFLWAEDSKRAIPAREIVDFYFSDDSLDRKKKTFDLALTLNSEAAREIIQKENWDGYSDEQIRTIMWCLDADREEPLKKLELDQGIEISDRIWKAIERPE